MPEAKQRAQPQFSIIMNVYNGERWLAQSLASVFAQSHGDWELIFWDDQSTDCSAAQLDRYAADPRVRYFYAPEQTPLGKARELAIREARGEWLAFLDQDDIWTADKLAKQAQVIASWPGSPPAIVYGRAMKFGAFRYPRDFDHWHEFRELPQGDLFRNLFIDSCFICQSSVCLRTAEVKALGGVPEEFRFCPDYFLYTELAHRFAAACTQDVVCWYRVHPNAMSRERYVEVVHEMLAIVQRWRHRLSPDVFARRCAILETLLGWRQVTAGKSPVQGLQRILQRGSLPYLLSRPIARLARDLRRSVRYASRGVPRLPQYPATP